MTIQKTSKSKPGKALTPEAHRALLVERAKKLHEAAKWYRERKATGRPVSYEIAGKFWGFSSSTISDVVHGKPPKIYAHKHQQTLSEEQENVLVEWICYWGERGVPMTRTTVAVKAHVISGKKIGQKWAYNFLNRHSNKIEKKWTRKLDSKRARNLNPIMVERFFKQLIHEVVENGIPEENIWNMDEKGIVCGGQERIRAFVARGQKQATQIGQAEKETTTVVECVCANGTAISPMVIFKGKKMSGCWCISPEEDEGLNPT